MQSVKLQICCLIVVLYYVVVYTKKTVGRNRMECNRLFDIILAIAPWGIVFDGLTAWTVNHMDVIPSWVNMFCHLMFYLLDDLLVIFVYLYMLDQMVGLKGNRYIKYYIVPGAISIVLIFALLGQVYFVQGESTNYSMGGSVYACFGSLFFHFILVMYLLHRKRQTIEKEKRQSIMAYVILCFIVLIIQIIFPEILVTSILAVMCVLCIYDSFENPYLRQLHEFNDEMVTGFSTLVENRDDSTGGHIQRTKEYVQIIIDEMEKQPKYHDIITRDYARDVVKAAPMHDVGKIATPDSILQKPGKLTAEEYDIMKEHAKVGGEIVKKTFADLKDTEYIKITYEVARYHHEKWNGKGYPEGLQGEEIPLHARIMAIADVFDAVSAKRCYRDAMPLERCFEIISEGKGTDFDPTLAELFLNARDRIIACYKGYADYYVSRDIRRGSSDVGLK